MAPLLAKVNKMHLTPVAFVTVALFFLTASVVAQVAETDDGSAAAQPSCVIAHTALAEPCLFLRPAVVGAPFSAVAVTTWKPPAGSGTPEMQATSRYYRDRHGRLRVEQGLADGAAGIILLASSASSRKLYSIDPVANTAHAIPRAAAEMMAGGGDSNRLVLPLAMNRWMSFHRLPSPARRFNMPLDEQSLGERRFSGVRATGTAYVATLPPGAFGRAKSFEMRDERWLSPDLKVVVYSRGEDPHVGVIEYQLTNIRREEPAADLFEPPPTVSDPPGSHVLHWENPYTLAERPLAERRARSR